NEGRWGTDFNIYNSRIFNWQYYLNNNQDLRNALFPSQANQNISDIVMEITDTDIQRPGHGIIRDRFRSNDSPSSRDLPVTTFNPEHEYSRELSTSIGDLFRRRLSQIQALGQIYGQSGVLDREDPASNDFSRIDDSGRNAAAIQQMQGPLRLHNNDDWRRFLLQKYRNMVSPPAGSSATPVTPSEAFSALINILFTYLQAFTVHVRYTNVYEIGDNYLNRDFPRALTGQLLHDCGVYALRVAYMLSLVRNELNLNFRFVNLPEHIGLVIYGGNVPSLIVNNDHFMELSPATWARIQANWRSRNSQSPTTDDQFVGEMEAVNFVFDSTADIPFRVDDVPAMNEHATQSRNRLYAFYRQLVRQPILGSASNDRQNRYYLFGQRYRDAIEQRRTMYNEHTVPYWNVTGPEAWNRFMVQLNASSTNGTIDADRLVELLTDFEVENEEALMDLVDAFELIQRQEEQIRTILQDNPDLVANGVAISDGLRAERVFAYGWENYRSTLFNAIRDFMAQSGQDLTITQVLDRVTPPFIPVGENSISRDY
ncbi:MAG: hypothetical protein AAFP76_11265, partial [Bacteroidota bacterium]